MKRKLLRLAVLPIIIVCIFSNANSQGLKKNDLITYAETMFKNDNEVAPATKGSVNIRVIRNFKKEFTAIENETWSMMRNGCYIVRFSKNNIFHRVEYNQKGHWLSTTKFYAPEYLSSSVRQAVMGTYHDYKIFCVAEVNVDSRTAFVVTLEDETSWLKIRLMGDKMEEIESYKKG
jgi:hypothetical protein